MKFSTALKISGLCLLALGVELLMATKALSGINPCLASQALL